MTNWYSIFYWLTVSDSVKSFFDTTSNIFTFFCIIFFIVFIIMSIGRAIAVSGEKTKTAEEDKVNPELRAWTVAKQISGRLFYTLLFLSLITWFGYMATPTKKDCLLIIAGGAVGNFITTDSSAKALPSDVASFLHLSLRNEVKELSEEAQKQLGVQSVQTPKEKLLDKVKTLSKEQLLEYLNADTTITK